MPGPAVLRDEHVSLHPVAADDHDFLRRTLNHPTVRPGFGAATPLGEADVEQYVDGFQENHDGDLFLACADGDPVGAAFSFDLDDQRGNVEIGYWIDPDAQGEGYATAAAALLVEYLFDERRLHKVNARVLAFNDGSRRVLEKLGFEREGRRREDFYVDGEYVHADLYGLLADEWRGGADRAASNGGGA